MDDEKEKDAALPKDSDTNGTTPKEHTHDDPEKKNVCEFC